MNGVRHKQKEEKSPSPVCDQNYLSRSYQDSLYSPLLRTGAAAVLVQYASDGAPATFSQPLETDLRAWDPGSQCHQHRVMGSECKVTGERHSWQTT
jgi:hypothetical protein